MPQDNKHPPSPPSGPSTNDRLDAMLRAADRQNAALERIARALELQFGIFPETEPTRG